MEQLPVESLLEDLLESTIIQMPEESRPEPALPLSGTEFLQEDPPKAFLLQEDLPKDFPRPEDPQRALPSAHTAPGSPTEGSPT